MTKALKATLLSGLVFPGAGHLLLRRYLRASMLMLAALLACSIILKGVIQRALAVVDQINSSPVPVDTAEIAEMVARTSGGANDLAGNVALLVLLACWLIGIIDSWRLGAADAQRKV